MFCVDYINSYIIYVKQLTVESMLKSTSTYLKIKEILV